MESADVATFNRTAELMRRFNDAFRFHYPTALVELVASDCVIENTQPGPEGSRHAGATASARASATRSAA